MRVVIDTNGLVSGLFFPESHPGRVISGWLSGCFEVVLSTAVVAEYTEVVLRPKFRRFGPEPGRLLELLTLSRVTAPCPAAGSRVRVTFQDCGYAKGPAELGTAYLRVRSPG